MLPLEEKKYGMCSITTDVDSICVSGTNFQHVCRSVTQKAESVIIPLLLNRQNFNGTSRIQLKCLRSTNFKPLRYGRPISSVNLDQYKNMELFSVMNHSMEFKMIIYLIDHENIPSNRMFTDLQLAVLASALNAAKKHVSKKWDGLDLSVEENSKRTDAINACGRLTDFECFTGSKYDKANQNFSKGKISASVSHSFLPMFYRHLEEMAKPVESWQFDYDTLPYHGCKSLKRTSNLRGQMQAAAVKIVEQAFFHLQAIGVKDTFPNAKSAPTDIMNTARVNEIVASGAHRCIRYLQIHILTVYDEDEDDSSPIIFSPDVGTTFTPMNPNISYAPNGNSAASYLHVLVKGAPAYSNVQRESHRPVRDMAGVQDDDYESEDDRPRDTVHSHTLCPPPIPGSGEDDLGNGDDEDADEDADEDWGPIDLDKVSRILSRAHRETVDLAELANEELVGDEKDDNVLDDYVRIKEALKYVYGHYCTNGYVGNAHTSKIIMLPNATSYLGLDGRIQVGLGQYTSTVAGGQVYQPISRVFTKKLTRTKFYSELAYLGIHLENLMQDCPDSRLRLIPLSVSEAAARLVIDELVDIVDSFKHNMKHCGIRPGCVRFEIFHMGTDLVFQHRPVPTIPYHSIIHACHTKEMNNLMVDMVEEAIVPLKTTFVNQRPDGISKDYTDISMPAKVSLMLQAEVVAQVLEVKSYSQPVLGHFNKERYSQHLVQVPTEYRVALTSEERNVTGLRYGVFPGLLPRRRFVRRDTTVAVHRNRESEERCNQYCVRLHTVVRNVREFVEAERLVVQAFLMASSPAECFDEDEDTHCVFDTPDYATLRSISKSESKTLYANLCETLWHMYQVEWSNIISKKTARICRASSSFDPVPHVQPISPESVPTTLLGLTDVDEVFIPLVGQATLVDGLLGLHANQSRCICDIGKKDQLSTG